MPARTLDIRHGGGLDGHGLILEHRRSQDRPFAEEHGFLDLAQQHRPTSATWCGSSQTSCLRGSVNMMDEVVMVRGDEIIGTAAGGGTRKAAVIL